MRNSVLILISAFFLSCEEPSNIGFQGQDGLGLTYFTDTLGIQSSTYLMDSAITSGQGAALVGSFSDPIFGDVNAVSYLQPALVPDAFGTGQTPLTTPDNAVYDSLNLRFINRTLLLYGDSSANITIQVHRLKESLIEGKNYNYDEGQAYEEVLLASKTLTRESFYDPSDSSYLYININLPDAVGQELFALANKEASETNTALLKAFRGFRISAVSGTKTLVSFNLGAVSSTGVSSLDLFYHTSGSTTADAYVFGFTSARYNQITANRTGTVLNSLMQKGLSISSSATDNKTFIQAGTGIASKLNFPSLSGLNNPQIGRAELTFSADSTAFNDQIPLAPYVTFLTLDDNQKVTRTNNSYGFVNYGIAPTTGVLSTYVDSTNLFVADITPYLQGLTSQNKKDNGIILVAGVPANTTVASSAVFNVGLNRIVLKDFKLNLYYTAK